MKLSLAFKVVFLIALTSLLAIIRVSNIQPNVKSASQKYVRSCETHVLIRTNNGFSYIEELIAYYIVQGVTKIYLLDYSENNDIKFLLENYIDLNFVKYYSKKFVYELQPKELHLFVMAIIEKYHKISSSIWLLVIDDDEFVLPSSKKLTQRRNVEEILADYNETLNHYLCRDKVQKYKSVRFRWRFVGTSGIQSISEKRGMLDIQAYHKMQRPLYAQETRGKTAFQINHPEVGLSMWNYQGCNVTGDKNPKRKGGPYFMHGNLELSTTMINNEAVTVSKWLGEYALLETGFTYHFARSKEQLSERISSWNKEQVVQAKAAFASKKDNNKKIDFVLSRWSDRLLYVIHSVRNTGQIDTSLLQFIQLAKL